MYKTILAYIDDPKMAQATVERITDLAGAFDSEVILAQVVVPEPTMANPWSGGFEDTSAVRDAEGMLAPWRGQLMQQGIGAHVSVLQGYDSVAATLREHCRATHTDLMLLPARLNADLLGWSAEGVVEDIIRTAPSDVLIVREPEPEW
ncbi:MAG: universal stress protein [Anaerolineae bacterium]